jgi:hypothetical protein
MVVRSSLPYQYQKTSFCHHLAPRLSSSLIITHLLHCFRRHSSSSMSKATKKNPKYGHLPLSTSGPEECALTGSSLLNTPYFNKGAAFSAEERKTFKLTGLLPQHMSTLEQQVKRAYQQYSSRQDDLAKNTFMTSLAEQNQVLYFRVSPSALLEHVMLYHCVKSSRATFPSLVEHLQYAWVHEPME